MRTHQKYFAANDAKTGKLAPNFILVANIAATDGGAKIAEGNSRSVGQLAIVLDGKLQSAPTVREAIRSTGATITGSFSREEAVELANVLRPS